jgi:hypothetical protein
MYILGADVSTSCTGLCLVETNNNVVTDAPVWLTHVSFEKCKTFWDKVDLVESFIDNHTEFKSVQHVYVEESLQMFRPGMSSAATISTLNKFNAIVSYFLRQTTSLEPQYIAATSARKTCGIKIQRTPVTTLSAKEQVHEWALREGGPLCTRCFERTKTGKLKNYVLDEIDSYVIARAGAILVSSTG